MSVLIRGMEMPTEGTVIAIYKLNGKFYASVHGTELCPIVPVPPHGDLIDRGALSKSLDRLCDRVCPYSKAQRKVMCGACPLGDAFTVVEDDAPTIIPASEEET